jgi:type II secretory pathway pseudopilin PulG
MGFMQMMANNFWLTVVLLLFIISIVSIVLGILLEVYKTSIRASEKRLELRNEQLRLQLNLEQQKKENAAGSPSLNLPQPKELSWEEQSQVSYEMGYQQHR